MNESRPEHEAVKRLLESAGIPEPSRQLRDRVTASARQAWEQTAADIPWQVPVRRLALSAAAASVIVCLANLLGNPPVLPGEFERPSEGAAVRVLRQDNGILDLGIDVPSLDLASAQMRGAPIDVEAIRNRLERLRSIIDEEGPDAPRVQPAPDKGRSRLLPTRGDYDVYS
jgi:hypothetical protein